MRNRLLAVVATVAVGFMTAVAVPSPATAFHSAPRVPKLDWQPCGALQCATATVPLDYDRPIGPTIQLALVRRLATDPAHRIGTLFVQTGGPGSSSVDV